MANGPFKKQWLIEMQNNYRKSIDLFSILLDSKKIETWISNVPTFEMGGFGTILGRNLIKIFPYQTPCKIDHVPGCYLAVVCNIITWKCTIRVQRTC